jgi:hypothetical protein
VHVAPEQAVFVGARTDRHGQADRLLAQPALHGEAISTTTRQTRAFKTACACPIVTQMGHRFAAQGKADASIAGRERQILELDGNIKRAEQALRPGHSCALALASSSMRHSTLNHWL